MATKANSGATESTPRAVGVGRGLPLGWRRYASVYESAMLPLAFVLLIIGFSFATSTFFTGANFSNVLGSQAVLFVLAMALLVPLTNNDIDLSVGALSGLVSMIVAVLNTEMGVAIGWCCLIGLAVGLAAGALNGVLAVRFNANSFIITLATGTVFTGLLEGISGEQTITGVSNDLVQVVFYDEFLGVPYEFYIGVVVMLIMWYVLTFTPFGQRALFVGQSRQVARLSGFRVNSSRMQGFLIAGFISALSGLLFVGTHASASPGDGNILLLPAYAAAFLGLTTIQPGRFNAIGTGLAVYFLAFGVAGFQLLGAQIYIQQVFYGGILAIAIVISRVLSKRRHGGGEAEAET